MHHQILFLFLVQQYQIKTYTGDVQSAGTDSDVYIYIHGELGTTGRRLLKKSKTHDDKFERNQVSYRNDLKFIYSVTSC